jgi:group II intron reverse transcriptase/maturase
VLPAAASRTQRRVDASIGLQRVREVARRDRRARFTCLLHHVTVALLRDSFLALKRQAAPGVDGVTWAQYEVGLEDHLMDLHTRVHRGTYRAQPSRRVYIPKADGRQRPLGIAALEDKIVQQAVATVLSAVYEQDFLGFSYGFRPGRSQHDALDALWIGVTRRKVNWVLDADIRGFYDTIDHGWLQQFVEHRIADPRILRLIRKWLRAGVTEDGRWSATTVGTPQGAVASPLLANVYLHYVFDLWVEHWRRRQATGEVVVVRYADDSVLGFQHRHEAEQFLLDLKERLQQFGLALHPEKTRLIEFGRFAAEHRRQRQGRKPETFEFLGFTHICGRKRESSGFLLRRQSSSRRLRVKLQAVKRALMTQRHWPIPQQGAWLRSVVQGYYNYHAVPGNIAALEAFRTQALRSWRHALRRRSQRSRLDWKRFGPLVDRWIPRPKILHPYPSVRFYAKHPRQEPSAAAPHAGICAGGRP